MIINIFAILLIQTLSGFQGFYTAYYTTDSRRLSIILLEYFCLAVFFIKLVFSFFCNQNINGYRLKYIREVASFYFLSLIFVFDLLTFVMTLMKVIFPTVPVVGILCFTVTVFSLPPIFKDFEIIEAAYFTNFRRRQYFTIVKIFIFNIFFAQFVSSIMMAISYWNL